MTLSLAFFYAPSRRNSTASHVVCLVDCGVRSDVQSAGYTDLVLVRAVCVRISTRPRRAYQSGSKTRGFWWRICSGPPRLPLTRFIQASRARSRRRQTSTGSIARPISISRSGFSRPCQVTPHLFPDGGQGRCIERRSPRETSTCSSRSGVPRSTSWPKPTCLCRWYIEAAQWVIVSTAGHFCFGCGAWF